MPIIIYVCFFKKHAVSTLPADWAAFGNYLGGVLTPILSIFSTVLLTYITILISKESSSKAISQRLIEKKQEAYIEVFNQLFIFRQWELEKIKLEQSLDREKEKFNNLSSAKKKEYDHEEEQTKLLKCTINENFILLKGVAIYLECLPIKYDHIFDFSKIEEYSILRDNFVSFINAMQNFNINEEVTLNNIPDAEINNNINQFLLSIKSQIIY